MSEYVLKNFCIKPGCRPNAVIVNKKKKHLGLSIKYQSAAMRGGGGEMKPREGASMSPAEVRRDITNGRLIKHRYWSGLSFKKQKRTGGRNTLDPYYCLHDKFVLCKVKCFSSRTLHFALRIWPSFLRPSTSSSWSLILFLTSSNIFLYLSATLLFADTETGLMKHWPLHVSNPFFDYLALSARCSALLTSPRHHSL